MLLAGVLLTGCFTTPDQAMENDTGYNVPLYFKGKTKPYRKYEVIKELNVTVYKSYAWSKSPPQESVEASLRTAAREVKADAVMDVVIGDTHVGISLGQRDGTGQAIRYTSR